MECDLWGFTCSDSGFPWLLVMVCIMGANQLVAGIWSWEPENSSSASGIYPNVEDNKAYIVKFTPTDSSASYDGILTASVGTGNF